MMFPQLQVLSTRDDYGAHFMDAALWEPVIRELCRRHGLPDREIRPGTPGTYPTFLLGQTAVIKFFGPLFDGLRAFQVERAVGETLASDPGLPVSRIRSGGQIHDGRHPWQYLVTDFIPGRSYGEDQTEIPLAQKRAAAFQIGRMIRRFHNLPLPRGVDDVFTPDLPSYRAKLAGWFHARLSCPDPASYAGLGLPLHLAAQAGRFLAAQPPETLPAGPLHLIHADLTGDHILGQPDRGSWRVTGLIDFGDCMAGDLFYELGPLYLDLFDADPQLLLCFLEGYNGLHLLDGLFARRCLAAALQHRFNLFSPVFERSPELAQAQSLDQLAGLLWDLGALP